MVPEASLMKVIECLLKENKRNVADKLMMNLNFKQFNYQFFIAVCLENCLFKGLIHLYFEENDNFMYPIIKILNSILHNSSNSKLNYEDVQDLKYRFSFVDLNNYS